MQPSIRAAPKRGTSFCWGVVVAASLAWTIGCQQGSRSRTRESSAHAGSGVGNSAVDNRRGAASAALPDAANPTNLPVVALRNWKLHVERFAGQVAASSGKAVARTADYSFDTSIGGNFAWREHGVDYGRWKLSDRHAQQLRDLVASAAFLTAPEPPDDGGPRLQITLAWPGGQRVATLDIPDDLESSDPTAVVATTTASALQKFADQVVASYRATLREQPAQLGWTIAVTGPFIAARETVTIDSTGAMQVQGVQKPSTVVAAPVLVAPLLLGRINHLLALPSMRRLPGRVAADTTVPIGFRLQLVTPPLMVEVESALLPHAAELRELWDAVAAARRAEPTR